MAAAAAGYSPTWGGLLRLYLGPRARVTVDEQRNNGHTQRSGKDEDDTR